MFRFGPRWSTWFECKVGMANDPFQVVACPYLMEDDAECAKMVTAARDIAQGELIYESKWYEYISLVKPAPSTQNARVSEHMTLLRGDKAMDDAFLHHPNAMYLKMAANLILNDHTRASKWAELGRHVQRAQTPTISAMSPEKHRTAINWLRHHHAVAFETLIYWANYARFQHLYAFVVANTHCVHLIFTERVLGLGFCPVLAHFNHDCLPNLFYKATPSGYALYAATDISSGTELCIAYLNFAVGLKSNLWIQARLYRRFGFQCRCPTHLQQRQSWRDNKVAKEVWQLCQQDTRLSRLYGDLCKVSPVPTAMDDVDEAERTDNGYSSKVIQGVTGLCDQLRRNYETLMKQEVRLGFEVAERYVRTTPYRAYRAEDEWWCQFYWKILLHFCPNRVYAIRGAFYGSMAMASAKGVVIQSKNKEQVTAGPNFVPFAVHYLNLRAGCRQCFSDDDQCLRFEYILCDRRLTWFLDPIESHIVDLEGQVAQRGVRQPTDISTLVNALKSRALIPSQKVDAPLPGKWIQSYDERADTWIDLYIPCQFA